MKVQTSFLRFDLDLAESLDDRLVPDALVVQEDRNLVMAKQVVLDLDLEHDLDVAYAAVTQHRPLSQGRYVLLRPREDQPYWIYQAVVHDLELLPTCRPGDVRRSLTAIVADALKRDIRSVAVQPLGMLGSKGLSFEEMVEAFTNTVLELSVELSEPLRLTLMLDDLDQLEEVSNLLRSRVLRMARRSFRTVDGDAAVVEVRQRGARLHFRFVPGSLSGYMVTRVAPTV